MLSREQAIDVLTYAASYDNRKPNAAAVAAWVQASSQGRWEFDDAVEAITQHYANTTEYLMPGHITAYLKAKRSQPPPAEQLAKALPSIPAASSEHIDATRRQLGEKLGWPDEGEHRAGMRVDCPWCHSRPGEQCTRPSRRVPGGRAPNRTVHPSRVDAATEADAPTDGPAPGAAGVGPVPSPRAPQEATQPRDEAAERQMLEEAQQ